MAVRDRAVQMLRRRAPWCEHQSQRTLRRVDGSAPDGLRRIPLAVADDRVLARFHRELMQPAFQPAELMTLEELSAARRDPSTGGLLVLDGDRPLAGMVTEDYVDGAVRLLGYLVVAAHARGRGLGGALLGELRPAEVGGLVVAEIEDPRIHAVSDAADPVARIRFYDRSGGRLLPLPYVQPSLRDGSPRVEGLLLITLGAAGDDVEGSVIG